MCLTGVYDVNTDRVFVSFCVCGVRVCMRACVRACMRACMCDCVCTKIVHGSMGAKNENMQIFNNSANQSNKSDTSTG